MEYVLQTTELTKQFRHHLAVNHVSLHVRSGEIYGFIGRNGAGKTTFMKMVSGLSTPTGGTMALFGQSGHSMQRYRSRIGSLIENPGLYPGFTGYENLKCKSLALGMHRKDYEQNLLELTGLKEAGKKKVRQYSLGMKQRLGIAMALVGEPDFLILDEPINGLDPQGIAEMRHMLLRLKEEKHMTIMISSHILEELYKVADTFGIIHNGSLIQELTREELSERCNDHIELVVDDTSAACTIIEQTGITNYKVTDAHTIHIYEQLSRAGELNTALVGGGCTIQSSRTVQEQLEDYFLNLTGGAANA